MEIHQAEITGFLKTILTLVLFYYAFKFLARLFAPYLMKKAVNKMKQKAEQQYRSKHQEADIREGETIIDKKPTNNKQSNKSVGEYVDFEEID